MYFPDPSDMGLREWTDSAAFSMINYPNSWGMDSPDWQMWGMIFFTDPFLNRYDPPNPYDYRDWKEWARRLADSMSQAPDSPNNGGPGGSPGPFANGNFLVTQDNRFITDQSGNFLITQ